MARQRVAQHKPPRDERKSKELGDFKRENNQLKRKVARLQKEIEILHARDTSPADFTPLSVFVPKMVDNHLTCGACGSSDLKTIGLPSGTIFGVCQSCGKRTMSGTLGSVAKT
jgi:hypothetical protein